MYNIQQNNSTIATLTDDRTDVRLAFSHRVFETTMIISVVIESWMVDRLELD